MSDSNEGQASALNLLASHPSLIGFENPGKFLVQVCKELFENSMDACRNSDSESRQIQVSLRPAYSDKGAFGPADKLVPLELVVSDNGVGFSADPEKLVQLFSSTKAKNFNNLTAEYPTVTSTPMEASRLTSTSGKFGVGLTASILHSSIIFGDHNFYGSRGVCKVTSRTREASAGRQYVVRQCTFGVDQAAGQVICIHRAEHPTDEDITEESSLSLEFVGSEVRIIVPGGSVVGSASGKLKTYFQRMHLSAHLLHCAVTYSEIDCLSSARVVIPFIPQNPPIGLEDTTAKIGCPFQRESAVRYIWARDAAPAVEALVEDDAGSVTSFAGHVASNLCFVSSSRAADGCRAEVAIFVEETPVQTGPGSGISCSKSSIAGLGANGSSNSVIMEVVRLANHVPLSDSASAVSCASSAAFFNPSFQRGLEEYVGLRPKGSPRFSCIQDEDGSGCQANRISSTLWIDFQDVAACSTNATVVAQNIGNRFERPGCPGGLGEKNLKLTCVIDLMGEDLSFGSLDKSYFADHTEYREAIIAALSHCFQQLKHSNTQLFIVRPLGPRKTEFEDMLHCEVPTFAGALASLIIEADEDETRACLDLLDLPSTHVQQSTLADDISTRVEAILISSRDTSSEYTASGRRRKHVRKKPTSDAAAQAVTPEGTSTLVNDKYKDYTVAELKDVLKHYGLKVKGVKPVLIGRIQEYEEGYKCRFSSHDSIDSGDADKWTKTSDLPSDEFLQHPTHKRIRYEDDGKDCNYGEVAESIDNNLSDSGNEADILDRLNVVFPKPYERLAFFSDDED